jgi:ATP-dependent 26S proteasome regulatory subunit
MPKAPDIDLDELSREDLVGGEIKNVVLNAARLALQRDEQSTVTMQDFRQAIAMERLGQWNGEKRGRIGFDG